MTTTEKKFKLARNRDLARRYLTTETLKEVPACRLEPGDWVVLPDGFVETQVLQIESIRTYTHAHLLIKYKHPYHQSIRTWNSPVLVEVAS